MHKCIPSVTVVSTHTQDVFPSGKTLAGGPARYIAEALRRLGAQYEIVTGDLACVEVVPGPEGELYRIPVLPAIPLPSRLDGDAVILSPIMREIDPDSVPEVEGLLAIDLQGFVRAPDHAGVAPSPVDLTGLLPRVHVVKAAEAELRSLTPESLDSLDGAIVLLTMGERGALIREYSQETFVPARAVPAPYTVGAGDTFLAAFVLSYLEARDPIQAAKSAARFTEGVLSERV